MKKHPSSRFYLMNNALNLIVGDSIGAMICALELDQRGLPAAIVSQNGRWGGFFSGIKVNDIDFDIGMNNFEFSSFAIESNDLRSYSPIVRSDVRRFSTTVKNYINLNIETKKIPDVKSYFRSTLCSDFVMTNKFGPLLKLNDEERSQAILELERSLNMKIQPLHASFKNLNQEIFLKESVESVSIFNHGKTLHKTFIEPMFNKILNCNSSAIPALLHRSAWTPLYYPETLLKFMKGLGGLKNETEFEYPINGAFSEFVKTLYKKLKTSKVKILKGDVSLNSNQNGILTCQVANETITAKNLVWARDQHDLRRLFSLPSPKQIKRSSDLTLFFFRMKSEDVKLEISTVFFIDKEIPFYRLSRQAFFSDSANQFSDFILEANSNKISDSSSEQFLRNLVELGFFKSGSVPVFWEKKNFKSSVNVPVFGAVEALHELIEDSTNILPFVKMIGPASSYYSNTFNDLVIQGLSIGRSLE